MNKEIQLFENGSTWLRADFHLHTKADNEFVYNGEENSFVTNYIDKLEEQKIRIATITNHNKFDLTEFKALRKSAKKKEIHIIPGVEFSANDGAKGIHVLIAFSDEWIYNKENINFIEQFINSAFIGITNPDIPPYPNSKFSFQETCNTLSEFKRDFFIILAHIDDSNGIFHELEGRNLKSFVTSEVFKKHVLGLQKSRKRDNRDTLLKLAADGQKIPAFVEGSDCAHRGISGIGEGNKVKGNTQNTFLKIGAYNFEAIKYALLDEKFRVSSVINQPSNGYIKSVTINGKKFKDTIHLNHAMNNLIGIRGSGKSSLLEVVRYGLDINLIKNENADFDYKNKLLNALLGSGGTVKCVLIDNQGKELIAEKTLGDTHSNVFNSDGELQIGLKPNAIVRKPIYFGQKDLSNIGDDLSTENLIGKLVGDKLLHKKEVIEEEKQKVIQLLNEIKKIESKLARKPIYEEKLASLKHSIQIFKDKEIDKKLDKQIRFNKDLNFIARVVRFEDELIAALIEFNQEYEDGFSVFHNYQAKETTNEKDIKEVVKSLLEFETLFTKLSNTQTELAKKSKEVKGIGKKLKDKFGELKEEFDKIKREINLPNVQADDYVKFTKDFDITKIQLSELEKLSKSKKELELKLSKTLVALQKLWHGEFEIVKAEIESVNSQQPTISVDDKDVKTLEIKLGYRENKEALKSYLNSNFKGTGIRESAYNSLVDHYPDLISMFNDLNKKDSQLSTLLTDGQFLTFKEYFKSNLASLLTYRTPDKFEILFKGKLMKEHSLGQRASALIIFLLTLKDSDLIIIDQPEDDLDNQTIYNDVIKVLKELKNDSQFIFATHNPNIPVLGDCEQIITCQYNNETIEIKQGSIDNKKSRRDIVDIMEGGKEAFDNRKMIYELWTQ